ncbi:MAG TPA: P1 family peptidase [Acidobacteriota bacterium]|nr:P1 family peptidase [Acidobacteriota bacterium]
MKWSRRQLSLMLASLVPAGSGMPWAIAPAAGSGPGDGSGAPRARSTGAPPGGGQTHPITLTDVAGVLVGHATRDDRPTGCTVIVTPDGATGGVAVRGAAPGTRETDLLRSESMVDQIHAVVLTGGSAPGLATADGVSRRLQETGVGLRFGEAIIPLVPAAVLYDLGVGNGGSAPTAADGYAACQAATSDPVARGNIGAGAGATVGKMLGSGRMKGGLGTAGFRFDDGTVVAALIAVNSRGDVRDPHSGRLIAGALGSDGRSLANTQSTLLESEGTSSGAAGQNTAIGVVATNRTMSKAQCNRLASVAHDGLARAVVPAHTFYDGDTLFALATNRSEEVSSIDDLDRIDAAAAAAVANAVIDAVTHATAIDGIPAARDIGTV